MNKIKNIKYPQRERQEIIDINGLNHEDIKTFKNLKGLVDESNGVKLRIIMDFWNKNHLIKEAKTKSSNIK